MASDALLFCHVMGWRTRGKRSVDLSLEGRPRKERQGKDSLLAAVGEDIDSISAVGGTVQLDASDLEATRL